MSQRILLIDNYDSFTFNLVQAFRVLGAEVLVYRNDRITVAEADAIDPTHLVISPGPGRPEDAGITMTMLEHWMTRVPMRARKRARGNHRVASRLLAGIKTLSSG